MFSSPYFLVKLVTAVGDGSFTWDEWWLDATHTYAPKVGGRYGDTLNPGWPVDGFTPAVGDLVLCRPADGAGGLVWELCSAVGDGGSGGGGGSSSCTGCGWVAALNEEFNLDVYLGSVASPETKFDILLTTDDGTVWTSDDTIEICDTDYTLTFNGEACDGPCLSISYDAGTAGTVTYNAVRDCCGCNFAIFAFPTQTLCPEEDLTDKIGCDRLTKIRVDWSCVEIPGWQGEGIYCIRKKGTGDPCEPHTLIYSDRCDPTIQICYGPYETEADALKDCGPPPNVTCNACTAAHAPNTDGTLSALLMITFPTFGPSFCPDCNDWIAGDYFFAYDPDPVSHGRPAPASGSCNWYNPVFRDPCTNGSLGGGGLFTITKLPGPVFVPGATWEIQLFGHSGLVEPLYAGDATNWDCKSDITLNYIAPGGPLCAWPSTITIRVV